MTRYTLTEARDDYGPLYIICDEHASLGQGRPMATTRNKPFAITIIGALTAQAYAPRANHKEKAIQR